MTLIPRQNWRETTEPYEQQNSIRNPFLAIKSSDKSENNQYFMDKLKMAHNFT